LGLDDVALLKSPLFACVAYFKSLLTNGGVADMIAISLQEYDGFGGDLIDAGVKMVSNFASALFKNEDKDSA
jgi:hypothetical protein